MIDEIKSRERDDLCGFRVADYQEDVLLVAAYFYLCSIFDEYGMDSTLSDSYRSDAVTAILGSFAPFLGNHYVYLSNWVDIYT